MAKYAVIKQSTAISSVTGFETTTLICVDLDTRKEYPTYIDQSNRNRVNWLDIINYPLKGFIITDVDLVQRKGKLVINADSEPRILEEFASSANLAHELKTAWRELDLKQYQTTSQGCKNNFNDLFSTGA
jgi:hypothetical protein